MSYTFMKTYELKQQTPLIHFQYDQDGATLRATEVKPKLDAYITQQYLKESQNKVLPVQWRLNDTQALNYRMTIICRDKRIIDLKTPDHSYDIFYGNTGRAEKIQAVMAEQIEIRIICRNDNLLQYIDSNIASFFISHNFGTMQRKGFGSFIIGNPTQAEIVSALCNRYDAKHCYSFDGGFKPFQRIKTIYSIMKSGINFHGYRRSLLVLYMHSHNIGNEKAWLKQQNMAPSNVGVHCRDAMEWEHRQDHPHYYVRALLGTSERVEYLLDLSQRQLKTTVKISNLNIQRFKSPIFFTVIRGRVYYVGETINSCIYNQPFEFSSSYQGEKKGVLYVPEMPASFIEKYLEFCFAELNRTQWELDRLYPNSNYQALSSFPETRGVSIQKHERRN